MSQLNGPLLELFRAHGVNAILRGDGIVFRNSRLRARAAIVREIKYPNAMTVQLDVALQISAGRTLLESCVGIGDTTETATVDAFGNFASNSLHVLLAAFFGRETDQVAQQEWSIGGTERRVILGNPTTRGKIPDDSSEQFLNCAQQFEHQLKAQTLGPETHWVRLYSAQVQEKQTVCEVMLNNATWEEMQVAAAAFGWPASKDFYSVRVFLVIAGQEEPEPPRAKQSFWQRFGKRS